MSCVHRTLWCKKESVVKPFRYRSHQRKHFLWRTQPPFLPEEFPVGIIVSTSQPPILFQFLFHYCTEMFVVKITNAFQFAKPNHHLSALITSSWQLSTWRLICFWKSFSFPILCDTLLTVLSSLQALPFILWSGQSWCPELSRRKLSLFFFLFINTHSQSCNQNLWL